MVDASHEVDMETLREMLARISHRGPDSEGAWSDSSCALGQRRLAIIDLSEESNGPMATADQSVWVSFNGEIYNFQKLRTELEQLGHKFRTAGDTEVLLAAYEQWGEGCISRLRGMFAFGLWDSRNRQLLLARDRVGKKPLFYSVRGSRLYFASELQSLLAVGEIERGIDWPAIDAYLSWGYVPAPQTAFSGIRKLRPGPVLRVDASGDSLELKEEPYFSLSYSPKIDLTEEEAVEEIRERLTEAVRLRLISDVPLGAFLSGGIDSSIVVGLMAQLSDAPVKTFSIGFAEAEFNELDHARKVADRWSTEHHEFVVEPDALSVIPLLVRHYGEPYADSSAIPTYYVSKLTREHVTVALNGDGGDESFAGYDRYWANSVAERLRRVPGASMSAKALDSLLPDSHRPKSKARKVHRFLEAATEPMSARYGKWLGYFSEDAKRALYRDQLKLTLDSKRPTGWLADLFENARGLHAVDAAMAVDVQSYLPFDLLVKVDITSMANSLEARSPFLDHEVMEFAARLPVNLKLRGRTSKYLLKKAFPELLPNDLANRPKMGFGVPVGEWMRGPLQELIGDSLLSSDSRSRDVLQPGAVKKMIERHLSRKADHTNTLWALLMLELWRREFRV